MKKALIALYFLCMAFLNIALAQQPQQPAQPAAPIKGPAMIPTTTKSDSVLVTIILKHQQDKNLTEIRRILEAQGFWEVFPPADVRVVSWTLAMGLGHIITVQVPAGSVRSLNLAVENGAWGAYDTEFYLTYDYRGIWQDYILKREDAKDEDRN
jgi:hypothetical protein